MYFVDLMWIFNRRYGCNIAPLIDLLNYPFPPALGVGVLEVDEVAILKPLHVPLPLSALKLRNSFIIAFLLLP